MAIRGQERIREESYASEVEKEFLKFLAFCLTGSVFFHEFGHFITAILMGYEVKGFCLLGFCTVDNPEEFDGYESLATGVLTEVSFSKSDVWKVIINLLSGCIFQIFLGIIVLRKLKIAIPIKYYLLICFASSFNDFSDIIEMAKIFI